MGNRAIKVAAIATSASAFALATGLTPADATRTVKIASHITIKDKGLKFSGKVSAKLRQGEQAHRGHRRQYLRVQGRHLQDDSLPPVSDR
jgi:hypothetical protein